MDWLIVERGSCERYVSRESPQKGGKLMVKTKTPNKKKPSEKQPLDQALSAIEAITVAGFKSIRDEQTIEIRPLTVLAGANSAGKSSMFQPLLLMKQTVESPFAPDVFRLDGPNVRFTSVDQLFCRGRKNEFRVGMDLATVGILRADYRKLPQSEGLEITETVFDSVEGKHILLRPGMKRGDFIKYVPDNMRHLFKDSGGVSRRHCFLALWWSTSSSVGNRVQISGMETPPIIPFADTLHKLIHIPALRGTFGRDYPRTAVGPAFSGLFTDYVGTVILEWQQRKDRRIELAGQEMEKLGLGWKVKAKPIGDAAVEVLVARLNREAKGSAQDLVSVADVGIGVSQALPVVAALLVAEPGQTVYVEQPEVHLHPRSQAAMASLLAAAAKRGVRVVAETHSSLLLLAIQTLVAEGQLSPDLVKLHWFTRNKEGYTEIRSADLDESGAFGDWPEDFGDVELKAQSRYLDAAEKRQFGM
jgi:hypothetical protein